jgi:two-component system cell cycle sensor histidine kinase/response regulator CckA
MAHESGTRPKVTRRGRVLIVDDDPMVAHAIALVLRDENDVAVSTAAKEALDRLAADASFDLVLCDLMMPGMSGQELYDAVRERHPGLAPRFVFVTGGACTPGSRAFLARVPNEQVEKPPDPIELRALVRRRVADVIAGEPGKPGKTGAA